MVSSIKNTNLCFYHIHSNKQVETSDEGHTSFPTMGEGLWQRMPGGVIRAKTSGDDETAGGNGGSLCGVRDDPCFRGISAFAQPAPSSTLSLSAGQTISLFSLNRHLQCTCGANNCLNQVHLQQLPVATRS